MLTKSSSERSAESIGRRARYYVVYYDYPATFLGGRAAFLYDVPLAHRVVGWLLREPVRLLDPSNGQEVARRLLPSDPTSVVSSYDGSRMAVFTDKGVYIYDVPPKFQ